MKDLVFSGVQPTGFLHLGNYLGAIKQWVLKQHEIDSMFCVVDLHAITTGYSKDLLKKNIYQTVATYIACGIDVEKSTIFLQSSVPEHAELAWFLGCLTPLGWLNRMTQFKEKAGKDKENASLGLYAYPVLMAADILLYKATQIPVGEDQKQHLELARDIAAAFNRAVDQEFFSLPNPLILKTSARVMSLRDASKKMSKSDISDYSRINLHDSADEIVKKIRKAKSDSLSYISYDKTNRPDLANLLEIYANIENCSVELLVEKMTGKNFSYFKESLAELLVAEISPIAKKISLLLEDVVFLDEVLKKGNEKSSSIAKKTMSDLKKLVVGI